MRLTNQTSLRLASSLWAALLGPLLLALLLPTTGARAADPAPSALFQYSTITALLQGYYDGDLSLAELGRHGDLAIGTVNRLDGELIGLDGHFYQARADGRVLELDPTVHTPFAVATFFRANRVVALPPGLTLGGLEQHIEGLIGNPNHFYALRIRGTFPALKVRSVPAQTPPYRPLTEIVNNQSVFDYKHISGTLVGFFTPGFMGGLNVPGFHFHFLSDDRKRGGHVLGLTTGSGRIALDETDRFEMELPGNGPFGKLELRQDSSEAVRRVERQHPAGEEPRRAD